MDGIVAVVAAVVIWLFGGDSGGQNTDQNQPPKTQPQGEQKDLAKDSNNPGGAKNATSVPTPALLPGLIGLGAAALRKRKSAIVKTED